MGTHKKLLIGSSAILASLGCTSGDIDSMESEMAEEAAVELGIDHHQDRIVVGFQSASPTKLALEGDVVLVKELHRATHLATISVPAHMDASDLVTMLRNRADIRFAELDRTRSISAMADQDPNYSYQWNMRQIGADAAWDQGHDGTSTIVAVIDTGVSDGGPDGLELTSGDAAGWDFVGEDADPSDAHGHGTHVAGTIAQRTGNGVGVSGVAHGAAIMPIRVLDSNGSGYSSDVASGILWAVDHGADVINLSLGSSVGSQAEQEAVAYASEMGVLVVAATGNEYQANGVSYPAAYEEVLAVGASNGTDSVVDYSNRGPELDILAPGGDFSRDDDGDGVADGIMQETVIDGEWNYYLFQGTSMASPHVAGAAAVLIGMGASADEAREILEITAVDVYDDGLDSQSGWGRMDLEAAVAELEYRMDMPVDEAPLEDEAPIVDEPEVEEPVADEDPTVDEPGDRLDDDGRPIDPRPEVDDDHAPEFTWIRAHRCDRGAHVEVLTNEVAGVMLCERGEQQCAKSDYGEEHNLRLQTNAAQLDLLARDPSGNVRVIPLNL
jgi:serine protease